MAFLLQSDIVSSPALEHGKQPPRLFHLSQGGNGAFRVGSDNRLTPLLFRADANPEVAEMFKGRDLDAFMSAVKRVIERSAASRIPDADAR